MKIIERQHLCISNVREMCIANNLYTCGTNAEYDAMFSMVNALENNHAGIITADDLAPIAADILAHSKTEQDMESILYALGAKIVRCYEVVEE